MARLVAEQEKKRAEGAALDGRLAAARAELARIEAETQRRLAMVPTPARVAAAAAPKQKDTLPVDKLAAPTRVRDVRFADDGDAERVIVDVGDKGADATVLRADDRGAVLKNRARLAAEEARAHARRQRLRRADPQRLDLRRSRRRRRRARGSGARRRRGARAAAAGARRRHADLGVPRARERRTSRRPRSPAMRRRCRCRSPAPAAPAVAATRHVYSGRRMDLDFVNADIHNIMRLISEVGQVNIVLADDVKGTVTMRLHDVPWDQALDVIAKSKGLGIQREGNLIRVAPQAVLEKELEAEVARQKAPVELKPIETKLIPLSYADGTQILPRINEVMSPRGNVSVDTRTNQLIITERAANIALAEDLVNNLDTQTPQVLIEARIVEASTNFTRDIGIQWGGNSINSAATGNPTGIAFPSTVGVAGGATDAVTNTQGLQLAQSGAASPNYVVNMPAAVGTGSGGALGLTLGSLNGATSTSTCACRRWRTPATCASSRRRRS